MEQITRSEWERAARAQVEESAARVVRARANGEPCDVESMLAFGGQEYCRTHRVVGPCPYGKKVAS